MILKIKSILSQKVNFIYSHGKFYMNMQTKREKKSRDRFNADLDHTTKTVYGSELASLTDTVASLYTKQKVKHSVRKSIPNKGML